MEYKKSEGRSFDYLQKGDGQPLILLHGYASSYADWIEFSDLICDKYRVIIPRLTLGYGSEELSVSFQSQARRVADFIDEIESEFGQAVICGLSYGGALAWGASLYLTDTKKPSQLILISPMAPFPISHIHDLKLKTLLYLAQYPPLLWGALNSPFGPGFIERVEMIFQVPWLSDTQFKKEWNSKRYKRKLRLITDVLIKFRDLIAREEWGFWIENFKLIHSHTLIVYGKNDRVFRFDKDRSVWDTIKNLEYRALNDIGHTIPIEAPEMLAEIVNTWISKKSIENRQPA